MLAPRIFASEKKGEEDTLLEFIITRSDNYGLSVPFYVKHGQPKRTLWQGIKKNCEKS